MQTTKIKILSLFFVIFRLTNLFGQKADTVKCKIFHDNSINRDYYKITDIPPSYKESTELMFAYLRNNLVIPKNCEPGCHKIYVELIVEKNGKLTFIKFIKTKAPEELKDAFKKVIANMPNWTPAKCDKKPVPSYFVIPFNIKVG